MYKKPYSSTKYQLCRLKTGYLSWGHLVIKQNINITPRIPASLLTRWPFPTLHTLHYTSLLTRLCFPMFHTQDPSIISDNVLLSYASHPGSQHHYWQGSPSLCFTPWIPASLLTRFSFPMLHTLNPNIITEKTLLWSDRYPMQFSRIIIIYVSITRMWLLHWII